MAAAQREELQLDQDIEFQRRTWRVQRMAWGFILVVLLAALAGVFGSGPLSHAVAGEQNGAFWVEYERFGRLRSPVPLRVHFRTPAGSSAARLWINRAFLDGVKVERVMPEPEQVVLVPDGSVFVFPSQGEGPMQVVFHLEAQKAGKNDAQLRLGDGAQLGLSQLIYP